MATDQNGDKRKRQQVKSCRVNVVEGQTAGPTLVVVVVVEVYLYGVIKSKSPYACTVQLKCDKFSVRLTEFCWQSVPKPWTGDSEVADAELGVIQGTIHVSTSANRSLQ